MSVILILVEILDDVLIKLLVISVSVRMAGRVGRVFYVSYSHFYI